MSNERKMDSGEFPAAGLIMLEADGFYIGTRPESPGFWDGETRSLISPLDTVPANEVNTLYNRMEIGFPALPEDMRETKRPGLPEDTDEYLSGTLCDPDEEFPVCPDCGMRHPRSDAMLVFTILVIR